MTYPHPACMEPDGGDGPCHGYEALAAEARNLRAELDRTRGDFKVALADLVAVYDAEVQGVAQQVTKPERIAAARAVLATYS